MEESFNSFEELFETLTRGNEIEFIYNGVSYYLLPVWHFDKIIGYRIGIGYSDNENIYDDENNLENHVIEGKKIKDIVSELKITFRCF